MNSAAPVALVIRPFLFSKLGIHKSKTGANMGGRLEPL